ncbi:MAG: stage III sporulation protein AB [Clostridia bacterium]|nr:stage III sporulation protein AB [Clostridia bacterium]
MQKLFGVGFFLIAVIVIGYKIAYSFTLRCNFLRSYLKFIKYIENETKYTRNILYELIKNHICQDEMSGLVQVFKHNLEEGYSVEKAWRLAVNCIKDRYFLNSEDCRVIYNFGYNLGKTDLPGQISNCEQALDLANRQFAEANEEKNTKSRLYFILILFLGLSFLLLIL